MRLTGLLALISVIFISACETRSVTSGTEGTSESARTLESVRQPVLVELFTSEGCSSCPPADVNLAFLEKHQPVTKAEIITLAFHVDYWDRLGWKDRFSSALYSQRQNTYTQAFKLDSLYTPQMIVDGREQFVGSDSARAAKEISKAADSPKGVVELSGDADRISVKITNTPSHAQATVYAAVTENAVSTRVERGENKGKTLEHVSVVRELKTLGELPTDTSEFVTSFKQEKSPEWRAENLNVVVFVQENESKAILAVGRTKLGG